VQAFSIGSFQRFAGIFNFHKIFLIDAILERAYLVNRIIGDLIELTQGKSMKNAATAKMQTYRASKTGSFALFGFYFGFFFAFGRTSPG
jgi:hypothetical protein